MSSNAERLASEALDRTILGMRPDHRDAPLDVQRERRARHEAEASAELTHCELRVRELLEEVRARGPRFWLATVDERRALAAKHLPR